MGGETLLIGGTFAKQNKKSHGKLWFADLSGLFSLFILFTIMNQSSIIYRLSINNKLMDRQLLTPLV